MSAQQHSSLPTVHMRKTPHNAKLRLLIVAILLSFTVLPVFGSTATAQTAKTGAGTGQALEIAPPLITISGDPGQVIKTQIKLRDISNGKLVVTGQVNDFVAASEDGTPKILMDAAQQNDNPYSIKGWVSPLPTLTMNPKQIVTMNVTITIPKTASPGGHYGVIRFSARPPELEGTGVSLSTSLGSLVLVTVNGATTDKLSVEEFSVNHNGKTGSLFESTPVQFVERIKNTGNIHEQPTGQVTITDMFGKKVAAVNVNMPPRNILPSSIRKFSQDLNSEVIGNKKLFGRYTAKMHLTYGTTSAKTLDSTLTFWVIPYRLIAVVIGVLVIGFFALRFMLKRYNQRIIAKAQGGKKPKAKK